MKKSAFPIRILGVVGILALLALAVAWPAGAVPSAYQEEPTPRPTATSAPYIDLNPDWGYVGQVNQTYVTGYVFENGVNVEFLFDGSVPMTQLTPISWDTQGVFRVQVQIPPQAGAGDHSVTAVQPNVQASATYRLIQPTPTDTPTPTNTSPPTDTPQPTDTPLPSSTPSQTPTASPTPTLRPVTPMVTISPIPPTSAPARTNTPSPTRTNTPIPGTPTVTLTPSITPTPSNTPGPGTPSATPQPTATPEKEISDTGGGWGTVFLWGFVLAGLLVVFRMLRVRSLRT